MQKNSMDTAQISKTTTTKKKALKKAQQRHKDLSKIYKSLKDDILEQSDLGETMLQRDLYKKMGAIETEALQDAGLADGNWSDLEYPKGSSPEERAFEFARECHVDIRVHAKYISLHYDFGHSVEIRKYTKIEWSKDPIYCVHHFLKECGIDNKILSQYPGSSSLPLPAGTVVHTPKQKSILKKNKAPDAPKKQKQRNASVSVYSKSAVTKQAPLDYFHEDNKLCNPSGRFVRFCFTYNNYTQQEFEAIKQAIDSHKDSVLFACIGREVSPINKTPHLQGCVGLKVRMTCNKFRQEFCLQKAAIFIMRGTLEQNKIYCTKEDKDAFIFGECPVDAKGKASALKDAELLLCAEPNIRRLIDVNNPNHDFNLTYIRHCRGIEKLANYFMKPRTTQPVVLYFYGPTGTGKTMLARELAEACFGPNETWTSLSDLKWFDGFQNQKCAIFDDWRTGHCSFSLLLRLLDRYPLVVPIKGDFTNWTPELIIITAPRPIREMYNLNYKTEGDLNQLERRIDKIFYFEKPYKESSIQELWKLKIDIMSSIRDILKSRVPDNETSIEDEKQKLTTILDDVNMLNWRGLGTRTSPIIIDESYSNEESSKGKQCNDSSSKSAESSADLSMEEFMRMADMRISAKDKPDRTTAISKRNRETESILAQYNEQHEQFIRDNGKNIHVLRDTVNVCTLKCQTCSRKYDIQHGDDGRSLNYPRYLNMTFGTIPVIANCIICDMRDAFFASIDPFITCKCGARHPPDLVNWTINFDGDLCSSCLPDHVIDNPIPNDKEFAEIKATSDAMLMKGQHWVCTECDNTNVFASLQIRCVQDASTGVISWYCKQHGPSFIEGRAPPSKSEEPPQKKARLEEVTQNQEEYSFAINKEDSSVEPGIEFLSTYDPTMDQSWICHHFQLEEDSDTNTSYLVPNLQCDSTLSWSSSSTSDSSSTSSSSDVDSDDDSLNYDLSDKVQRQLLFYYACPDSYCEVLHPDIQQRLHEFYRPDHVTPYQTAFRTLTMQFGFEVPSEHRNGAPSYMVPKDILLQL